MKAASLPPYLILGHPKNISVLIFVLLTIIGMTVASQGLSIYTLLIAEPAQPEIIRQPSQYQKAAINPANVALLFGRGQDPQTVQKNIPKTNLRLILKGAFANADDKLSSAIIEGSDRRTALYYVGDTLPGNAQLDKVHSDHIVISRNGVLETLYFPEAHGQSRFQAIEVNITQLPKAPIQPTQDSAFSRPEPTSLLPATPVKRKEEKAPIYTPSYDQSQIKQRMQELRERMRALENSSTGG
ncbi:type II secretion system protein N [Zooshikella ganghwensis]|uniref:Type II secretion system protein GspC N-terminal domain-containing protein n=1 Tax=Zooshikella ganghwensis TaxID=202772 RepID=A0A4P9VN58_9GAMM|nr:type II secretion system protein N [Zooshikella ganghwensis]RDH44875.1 hypothetical protein B9G39_16345 [Zooshikella ganghwensis]